MNSFDILRNKYDVLLDRVKCLETENARLKEILHQHNLCPENDIPTNELLPAPQPPTFVIQSLSLQEKVELFRSLFKGREDVFAKRWYSNVSRKSGYQPVCDREWNRDYCDKKNINVPNVLIANLQNFLMNIYIVIWREKMNIAAM